MLKCKCMLEMERCWSGALTRWKELPSGEKIIPPHHVADFGKVPEPTVTSQRVHFQNFISQHK